MALCTYLVKYNFEAQDDNELSVFANEIVDAVDEVRGDWVRVKKRDSPSQRGYVPMAFLEIYDGLSRADVREPLRSAPRPPPDSPLYQQPSPATTTFRSSVQTPASGPAANPSMSTGPSAPGAPPASTVLLSKRPGFTPANSASANVVDSFSEMLTDFRQRLAKIMEDRDESFRKLERSIASTAKEIQACQERNVGLTQKIMDLDAWIEEEKSRWREQIEAEKRNQKLRQPRASAR
jgi:hypothetical protein